MLTKLIRLSRWAKRLFVGMLSVTILSQTLPVRADTVRTGPDTVQFDFELKDDSAARTCNLMTMIVFPSGEAVNFRLIFGFPKSREVAFYGFTADAGDIRIRNGMPEGMDQVQIVAADITSANFNSADQMQNRPTGNKGILKVIADPAGAPAFVAAVTSGRFAISISRATGGSRTYIIDQPPPQEPIGKFTTCVGTYR